MNKNKFALALAMLWVSAPAFALIVQVQTSDHHSCAIWESGRVKCWGGNGFGELGTGDSERRGGGAGGMGASLPFVSLGQSDEVISMALGVNFSCALLRDGRVKCWGSNSDGQLGVGPVLEAGKTPESMGVALAAVPLGEGLTATKIAAGDSFACALLGNGTAKCWGSNAFGQLGQGDSRSRGKVLAEMGDALPPVNVGQAERIVDISASANTVCVLLASKKVKCWGGGQNGILGSPHASLGTKADEMGDNLPFVNLYMDEISHIVAGGAFFCALSRTGKVKCWGSNSNGSLGLGDAVNRGANASDLGANLPYTNVSPGLAVTQLSCGTEHCCALLQNNAAKCWGAGTSGQLGTEDIFARGNDPNEMGDNLPFVDLGPLATVSTLSARGPRNCMVVNHEKVRCFGNGQNGALGYDNETSRGNAPGSMGENLPNVPLE